MAKRITFFAVLFIAQVSLFAQQKIGPDTRALFPAVVENTREIINAVPDAVADLDTVNFCLELLDKAGEGCEVLETGAGFKTTLLHQQRFGKELTNREVQEADRALQYLKKYIWNNSALLSQLETAVGDEKTDQLLAPMDKLANIQTRQARDESLKRLDRFEQKYGPNSARLNVAEAVVNYFILRRFDAFGLQRDGSPGPMEMVLAYTTSYFSYEKDAVENNDVIFLSAVEIGLRYYFLMAGWGEGSYLKPGYCSFGLLIAGEENGFLRNPLKGDKRLGAFVSWGSLKCGYLFTGGDQRFLITRQMQLLPLLF